MTLNATTPTFLETLSIARNHHANGRHKQADEMYRRAMEFDNLSAELWGAHGSLALELAHVPDDQGLNLPAAAYMLERACQLDPNNLIAHGNLGSAYFELGRLDDAVRMWKRAMEIAPNATEPASAYLFGLQCHPDYDEAMIAEETWKWRDGLVKRMVPNPQTSWPNDRSPDRKLRVGYVGGDWGEDHPVGRMMKPLMGKYDGDKIFPFIYDLKKMASFSDSEIADVVRKDEIDILVDLSGHTRFGRPLLFAMHPAPVTVYHLAMPGDSMTCDYYTTDRQLTPHNDPRALYLDSYFCYSPPAGAPKVGPLPALKNGYITFGSLNNFTKVSAGCLATWRRILDAVPNSHTILFCPMGDGRKRAAAALGAERVEFVARQSTADYLKAYNRIDVALDTFPYCGGATTCDALWMGCPVVTLAGNKPVARNGLGVLKSAGFSGWCAASVEQYIRIALWIAMMPKGIAVVRETIRDGVKIAPLMDAKAYAKNFEAQLRSVWRKWCLSQKD